MTNQANIDTAAATDVIEYVPLTDLYLSDLNPRQDVAEEGIDLGLNEPRLQKRPTSGTHREQAVLRQVCARPK